MSIVDLDGGEHPTRNKAELNQRERVLWCTFRIMDAAKRSYSIRSDVTLQPEYYLGMLLEQGVTQADDRIPAFVSCSLMNRIEKLPVLGDIGKLKMLLTGAVFIETSEPTLGLEDFLSGERITCKPSPCPSNNAGLVTALKNVQMVLQVCFSDAFGAALDSFIDKLEGVRRPMELVASDFLKHSVQLSFRRFFRDVSTVRGSVLEAGLSLKTPELGAKYLTAIFDKLAADLSDHPSMVMRDAYFRLRVVKPPTLSTSEKTPVKKREATVAKTEKQIPFAVTPSDSRNSRPCVGHLGDLLGAVDKDGRPYACKFGKDCAFRHLTIEDKSKQRLLDIVGSLTATARADLMRAVVKRS